MLTFILESMAFYLEKNDILSYNNTTLTWDLVYSDSSFMENSAVLSIDSGLLIIGGHGRYCSNKVFKFSLGSLSEYTPMLSSRSSCAAIYIDDKVYVIGGVNTDSNEALISCEMLITTSEKWATLPHMAYPHVNPSLCYNNSYLYAFGGVASEMIERFNLATKTWSTIEMHLFQPLSELGLISVDLDKILVLGGRTENNLEVSEVWEYDFIVESAKQKRPLLNPCAALSYSKQENLVMLYGRNKVEKYEITLLHEEKCEILRKQSAVYNNNYVPEQCLFVFPIKANVLVVRKLSKDVTIENHYKDCVKFLLGKGCVVYTELNSIRIENTMIFSQDDCSKIEVLVTLGGDGTVIWATKLFQGYPVPPVISFNLGTLGFMAKFTSEHILKTLNQIIQASSLTLELYTQLHYTITEGENTICGQGTNEICVDKGAHTSLIELDLYLNEEFCTTLVGDGIIIATPCGSTAYSLSAGGPIVYQIPSILITPICPHSLSFRPLVIPDNFKITLKVPDKARLLVWISIDGNTRHKLSVGSSIEIRKSEFSIPCN